MAQMGMGHDQNNTQENYGNGGNENWVEIHTPHYASHQQSAPQEYFGYSYIQPPSQSMANDMSISRMAPLQNTHNGPHHHHQQLLPLIMPSHPTWPSMLTNPANGYQHQLPMPILPPSMPPKPTSKLPSLHGNPSPRKTLSDADRRRMCQYHEDNPTTKQTEIGGKYS